MNAVTPIDIRPVLRPAYNNARIANFGSWYAANEPALSQYFRALPGDGEFQDFCFTQYDIECAANPRPVYLRADLCEWPDISFEEAMERDTGKPAVGPL